MIYNLTKFKLKLTLVVFLATTFFGFCIWQAVQSSASVDYEKPERLEKIESPQLVKADYVAQSFELRKKASFGNVTFMYDTSLFSNAKGEVVQASLLEDASSKPDGVYPKHLNFIFEQSYTGEPTTGKDYYSSIRIHVYPLEEYKQAYAFYGIDSEAGFDKIRELTTKKHKLTPTNADKQLPYVPFADAHQAFCSKSKVINFQNGKGFLYITQWQQDEIVINNERLELIFQGLSDDNKNFVLIEFKVSAKGLPQNNEANFPDKYRQLNDTSNFLSKSYQRLYKKYALETAAKTDKIPSENFTPNLNSIEDLIRSFSVK